MKKIGLIYIIGLMMIVGGVITTSYFVEDEKSEMTIGPPEGYEKPKADIATEWKKNRVEQLKIEKGVLKYYKDNLEYVAFAPGSGWIKLKTIDGISPTLSFKKLKDEDIQGFNRFTREVGIPLQAEFTDNTLRLSLTDAEKRAIMIAKSNTETWQSLASTESIISYEPDIPAMLAMKRSADGKVRLVAQDKPAVLADKSDGEDIKIARKDENPAEKKD